MLKLVTGSLVAIALASGAALAQAPATGTSPSPSAPAATTAPAAKPATTAPAVTLDAAGEAKFKGYDKNNNGALDGAEVASFRNDMTKIDTDKDGRISRAEFGAALKSGLIK